MEGIIYLTAEENKKRFVQIDLEKYGEIVEDMFDRFIIQARINEESVPLEEVIAEWKSSGKLDK